MALSLSIPPGLFDNAIAKVRSATPANTSSFFLKRPINIPWSPDVTPFILTTSEPEEQHEVIINNMDILVVVPGAERTTLPLQMLKGPNSIRIKTRTQSTTVNVAATALQTWFDALGREFYLAVDHRYQEVINQLNSPWTTRVTAHFYPYNDLFLPLQMARIQQTRMVIAASMGGRLGYTDGVLNVAKALSYSTPLVSKATNTDFCMPGKHLMYPGVTSHPTTDEQRGIVVDLWFPNHCLAAKQALVQLVLSIGAPDVPHPKPLQLVDFDDYQVLLRSNGGDIEVHSFDPSNLECVDLTQDIPCLNNQSVFMLVDSVVEMGVMMPMLPFDLEVENAINFGFWDMGFNLDQSEGSGSPGLGGTDTFDTIDPDDPFGTGFLGISLSRRFDFGCLDSQIQTGQRLNKFVYPLKGLTGLTPDGTVVGSELRVDAELGAPAPLLGNNKMWGVSPRTYLYEGDHVRFEEPDTTLRIETAWPLFNADNISKSDLVDSVVIKSQRFLFGPPGFFEPRHESRGVRVTREIYNGIAASVSVVAGSPTLSGTGTAFLTDLSPGDRLIIGFDQQVYTVLSVTNDFTATLTSNSLGTQTNTALFTEPQTTTIVSVNKGVVIYNGVVERVAVTLGSTSVIGTGTSFLADIAPGERLLFGDNPVEYEVASVPSNVALTLTSPYLQPTSGGLPLSLKYPNSALLAGNPNIPQGVDVIANVYEPIRDREDQTAPPFSGRPEYEVTFSSPLLGNQSHGTILDLHVVPRVIKAASIGDRYIYVATDTRPEPGDRLYVTDSTYLVVDSVNATEFFHPVNGTKIYVLSFTEQVYDGLAASVSATTGSAVVTGTNTLFLTDLAPGDKISFGSSLFVPTVLSIADDTTLTLTSPYLGPSELGVSLDLRSIPVAFTDNQELYSVSATSCWPDGMPVTPLTVIGLSPPSYVSP